MKDMFSTACGQCGEDTKITILYRLYILSQFQDLRVFSDMTTDNV